MCLGWHIFRSYRFVVEITFKYFLKEKSLSVSEFLNFLVLPNFEISEMMSKASSSFKLFTDL